MSVPKRLPPLFLRPAWNNAQIKTNTRRSFRCQSSSQSQIHHEKPGAVAQDLDKPPQISVHEDGFPRQSAEFAQLSEPSVVNGGNVQQLTHPDEQHLVLRQGQKHPRQSTNGQIRAKEDSLAKRLQRSSESARYIESCAKGRSTSDFVAFERYTPATEGDPNHRPPLKEDKSPSSSKVLLLMNATTNLTETDFRRLIPKGQYISGWISEGDIVKVIPGRDPSTLRPLSFYYLIFTNPRSAYTYLRHVTHLHHLALRHTPTSLASPIPPPPNFLINGIDINSEVLQSYTLLPPSQPLRLRQLKKPLSRTVQALIDNSGYERLTVLQNEKEQKHAHVRFHLEGGNRTMSLRLVQKFLNDDGRVRRNLPWRLIEDGHRISLLDAGTASENASGEAGSVRDTDILGRAGTELDPEDSDMIAQSSSPAPASPSMNIIRRPYPPKSPTPAPTAHRKPILSRNQSRWLLTFVDEAEARRFVRDWHKQPFPPARPPADDRAAESREDGVPVVHAELVW